MEWLGDCPLPLPVGKTQRFSEIVPADWWFRIPFRILRFMFGETGRVSNWTRNWQCVWRGEILLGYHKGWQRWGRDRAELMEWEAEVFIGLKSA